MRCRCDDVGKSSRPLVVVHRAKRRRAEAPYLEACGARLSVPLEVDQLGKSGALEQVAGGGGDPRLEPGTEVCSRLDFLVNLLLNRCVKPRHRQVCELMRFNVLNN